MSHTAASASCFIPLAGDEASNLALCTEALTAVVDRIFDNSDNSSPQLVAARDELLDAVYEVKLPKVEALSILSSCARVNERGVELSWSSEESGCLEYVHLMAQVLAPLGSEELVWLPTIISDSADVFAVLKSGRVLNANEIADIVNAAVS